MKRSAARIAAVVVVLACSACARQAGATPPTADRLTTAAVDLVTDSGARPARRQAAATAEEEVTRRCMAARAETYRPYVSPLAAGDDEQRLVDLPLRRARGYQLADPPVPPSAGPDEKSPGFHRALFGDSSQDLGLTLPNGALVSFPSTGCVAEARAAVYGDVVRWARVDSIPQVLGNELRARVKDRPELAAATTRWADCMRAAGFPYTTTGAARDAADADPARETAIAVADGECDLRIHLTGTELALRRAAAGGLSAAERRELNDLAAVDCAAAPAAARLLNRPATPC